MHNRASRSTGARVLVLASVMVAASPFAAGAREMTIRPTAYVMHLDEIHPAPGIGQSFATRSYLRHEGDGYACVRHPDIQRPVAMRLLSEGAAIAPAEGR